MLETKLSFMGIILHDGPISKGQESRMLLPGVLH